MAKVSLSSLRKIYPGTRKTDSFEAVKSIDLEIEDREFMVLVGPSGCGKSTTLRMIAGLEEVTSGSILIEDKEVNNVPPKDRDIAMVFQNYALYPHMTIYENMAFGLKLRKRSSDEIQSRVRSAAKMLDLDDLLNRKPKALSGGQRQRVALGRAIVRKPKVFLFDEPLSNLDAKMRVSTRTELSKLHTRLDATMIYVTHDQVEAMTMGDRICVMNEGRIMQVAEPIALYSKPSCVFVASFIGSPPMNLLPGTISHENGALAFIENSENPERIEIPLNERLKALMGNAEGKNVVFGIRPEDVTVIGDSDSPSRERNTAMIEAVEPMGSETYLHLQTPAKPIIARTPPEDKHIVGNRIRIGFDLDKAHFFDAITEERID